MRKISLAVAVVFCLAAAFTVQSATKPVGTIKVVSPGVGLELKIGDKPAPVPNGKEVPLPPATYTPFRITCGAKAGAEIWTIKCTGPGPLFGQLKEIIVADGQVTNIEAGQPFAIKVSIANPNGAGGKPALIGMSIVGKSGEVYTANTLMKGLSVAPKPQFKITDDKGTTLTKGEFEYG
jgi:hypothetical protein